MIKTGKPPAGETVGVWLLRGYGLCRRHLVAV